MLDVKSFDPCGLSVNAIIEVVIHTYLCNVYVYYVCMLHSASGALTLLPANSKKLTLTSIDILPYKSRAPCKYCYAGILAQ